MKDENILTDMTKELVDQIVEIRETLRTMVNKPILTEKMTKQQLDKMKPQPYVEEGSEYAER